MEDNRERSESIEVPEVENTEGKPLKLVSLEGPLREGMIVQLCFGDLRDPKEPKLVIVPASFRVKRVDPKKLILKLAGNEKAS